MNRYHHPCVVVLLTVTCLTLLMAENTRSESSAPDAVAIGAAVDDFHQALATGDSKGAMSLLLPDALIIEAGTVQTRAEYESEHLEEDIAFAREVPGKQTSRSVQQAGEVAWVTTTFRVTGKFHGKSINNLAAETAVLTRTADGWRIRTLHWSSHKAKD